MKNKRSTFVGLLILGQVACALFFLYDVTIDLPELGLGVLANIHIVIELIASVLLCIGIYVEWKYLSDLARRNARAERAMAIAAGGLHDLMERNFRDWGLTPSEADVATFALKGISILEIADLRGSREGTIKAHLNGIYRKAGVSGRAQLVSLLIEELMSVPLNPEPAG